MKIRKIEMNAFSFPSTMKEEAFLEIHKEGEVVR